MGNKPRSRTSRTHRHTDYSQTPAGTGEDFLSDLLQAARKDILLLILDGVQDPHNLGAILRTAEAAGVHAVLSPKDRSVPVTEVVRRVACGGAERVPFVRVTNLARTMRQLKEAGIWIVGTDDKAVESLYERKLTGPLAIVMGSEGKGMRRLTSEHCDFIVKIPMLGEISSLNVSVAAGVCLFEVARQRRAGGNSTW